MLVLCAGIVSAGYDINVKSITVNGPTKNNAATITVNVENVGNATYTPAGEKLYFNTDNGTVLSASVPSVVNGTNTNVSFTYTWTAAKTYSTNASFDGVDDSVANNNFAQSVTVANNAPIVQNISDQSVIVGDSFTVTAVANDNNGDAITFSLSGEPTGMTINANTGVITWDVSLAGTYNVVVSANDGTTSGTTTFQIVSQLDQSKMELVQSEVALGGENQDRGIQITQVYTLKNSGTKTINALTVTGTDKRSQALDDEYQFVVSMGTTTLAPGATTMVSISMFVPVGTDSQKASFGNLNFVGTDTDNVEVRLTEPMTLQAKSYLEITDVDLDVEGDKESMSYNEDYDNVKEGDSVTISVTIANTYSDSDDIDLDNAYFEATADDDSWKIDEEKSDKRDVSADNDKTFKVSFTVPDDVDDDSTDVVIRAYGDDHEDNFEHYDEFTFSFTINREDDEITITDYEWSKNPVDCNDGYANLDVTIKNTGNDDQDEVTLEVVSDKEDLNWHKRMTDITLDSSYRETYEFLVPLKNVDEGSYFIEIMTYYNNDDESDTKAISLEVVCAAPSNNNNDDDNTPPPTNNNNNDGVVITNTGNTPVNTGNQQQADYNPVYGKPVGSSSSFTTSPTYIGLLVLLIVVVLAIIVVLAVKIAKK